MLADTGEGFFREPLTRLRYPRAGLVGGLGELQRRHHPASVVLLQAQGESVRAGGGSNNDGRLGGDRVDRTGAHVDGTCAACAGGQVHGCQRPIELGQEPSSQLRCLARSRDDFDDGARERCSPLVGIGKGVRYWVKGVRGWSGREGVGLVLTRRRGVSAVRGRGAICVLMAGPGEG